MNQESDRKIIDLLLAKNRCLHRLFELGLKFAGNWESLDAREKPRSLEVFQGRRESLFRGLDLYDRELSAALKGFSSGEGSLSPSLAHSVGLALSEKNALIQKLIPLDREIIAKLESEKGRILAEITETRRGHGMVNKFKSQWIRESGEGLDQKL